MNPQVGIPQPQDPVDDLTLPWTSFWAFLEDRTTPDGLYLQEINHETGSQRRWTGDEWRRLVEAVGAALTERGVRAGDVVATLVGNSPVGVALAHACWASGITYMPLNAGEPVARLAFLVDDAHPALLVHTPPFAELSATVQENTDVSTLSDKALLGTAPSAAATESFSALKSKAGADRPALLVYTSGTTGDPKGVPLTVRNILTHTHGLADALGWTTQDRVLTVLPIHHVNGLLISCTIPWMIGGSTILTDRFRTDTFWRDATENGATVASVVPSLLEFLVASASRPQQVLREVLCGAGPLRSDAVIAFEDAFNVPVRHLYGLSEVTAVATLHPPPNGLSTCPAVSSSAL